MTAPGGSRETVRWTGRAYLVVGVGSFLAILAVAARNPVPLFVALPLLIAPFASAALIPRRGPRADLVWEAGGLGADVEVEGTLRGSFGGGSGNLFVRVLPPPGTRQVAPPRFELGREAIRFTVGWRLPEPTIASVAAPAVLWRDPIGLCESEVEGDRPELTLSRYPAELHRLGAIRLDRTVSLPGETPAPRPGRSGEFHSIREATRGEPRGRINWKASARAGRLLANEYLVELTGDMLIVLDARPVSADPALDARLLGISKAAVYGIADSLLRSKIRVGFAAFGEFLDAVPLSVGRGHRLRVLNAITSTRLSPVAGPAARCAYTLQRFFRPGVTTLVVSAWAGEPSEGLLPYLRRQGFPPLLVSPSPLPLLARAGELPPEEEELASRLERLERRVRLAETWRYGPVVDWEDYWSLQGLALFLRGPTHRRVA